MSNLVAIAQLKPGMVILSITQQNGPVKIRKSGLVTSDAMVQGLMEMGVQEVEIDPEQTVEIAPTTQHRTQTQALLRGDRDTNAQIDNTLSEQFNRSLFLPTVQGLPSVWKRYGKDAAVYAVLIVGGLCIGYTTATSSQWLRAFEPIPATRIVQTTPPSVAPNPTTSVAQLLPEQTLSPEVSTQASQPVEQNEATTEALQQAVSSSAQDEGRIINTQDEDDVQVSPELLARFNAAIEALDTPSTSEPQTLAPEVNVHNELPRVDQLPVRLMTRLPTMNFSAHMYASRPSDRWVRVNGAQAVEGDWIDGKVQIVNIEAQKVVLSFENTLFTMAALTDW